MVSQGVTRGVRWGTKPLSAPLLLASILILAALCIVALPASGHAAVAVRNVGGVHVPAKRVYKQAFQDKQHRKVKALKRSRAWTPRIPLVIANPYGTCNTGLYVFFKTKARRVVTYTVHSEGFQDFTRTVKTGSNVRTKKHEFLLTGCVQGHLNTVRIDVATARGRVLKSCTFAHWAPVRLNSRSVTSALLTTNDAQRLTGGLYAVFGSTQVMEEDIPTNMHPAAALYDNSGTLRMEIPVVAYWPAGFLFKNHRMFYAVSHKKIVRMNATGRISRIYKLPSWYRYHHAYCFGHNGDLLMLGTSQTSITTTTEDLVLSMKLSTGAVTCLFDMKNLLGTYYWQRRFEYTGEEPMDWAHLNSMDFIGQSDDLLLSSRETSTVVAVGDIYSPLQRGVRYMIGSQTFWSGTGYENKLLAQEGEFSLQAGQHAITYDGPVSYSTDSYYVSMFDNSFLISRSRPDYAWNEDAEYSGCVFDRFDWSSPSRYRRYRVNPVLHTFTLDKSFDVAQSHFVSSTQNYNGNLVIGSGESNVVAEYTQDGELLQSMTFANDALRFYRAFKYDFTDFCFA